MNPSSARNIAVVGVDISATASLDCYKAVQRDLERRSGMVRVHERADITPGAILRFSDRTMEVMKDGSLRGLPDVRNEAPGGTHGGWYQIINRNDAPTEIRIYGEIGTGWDGTRGVDAQAFANELAKIPRQGDISLRVHSPGGSVWDGLLIYNLLRGRRDQVVAYIDGLAASMGSVIVMAAREVHMPKQARWMMHDAQGLAMGDSAKMKQVADLLERESNNIADIYAEKSGKTRAQVRQLMAKTTWMNGEEAKAAGFIDVVTDGAPQNCAEFDLSHFRSVPGELRNHNNPAIPGVANPTQNPMRDQIFALLRKHGIQVSNTATNAELGTLLAQLTAQIANSTAAGIDADRAQIVNLTAQLAAVPAPAPAPAPANVLPLPAPVPTPAPQNVITVTPEMWNQMQAQLNTERTARITNSFESIVGEGRPYIDRATWLPRALQDETILGHLRTMPVQRVGADPVRNVIITNSGNPTIEAYNKLTMGRERMQWRVANHDGLAAAMAEFAPRNSNTMAAGLVPDYLADGVIHVANNKLAMLSCYSRNFSTDALAPKKTVQVRKGSRKAGEAAQLNPTNFELGDSQLDAIPVAVDQVSRSFQITNEEANKGFQLADLAVANAEIFANKISDIVSALLITANYGAVLVVGAAANFDPDDLKPIRAAAKDFSAKNLCLDGGHLSYLLPTNNSSFKLGEPGAYGFDLISENNRWTGAVANLVGHVCAPAAMAVASGLPVEMPAGEFIEERTIAIPGLNLTVKVYVWFSRNGRVRWASYDVMFGAYPGDATQMRLLATA